MKTKLFKCVCFGFLSILSIALPAMEQVVPYILLRRSPRKNVLFLGTVGLSRSAKLSFLSDVQLTYVAPINEAVRGKIIDANGKVIRQGDILAKARDTKEKIIVNISDQKVKKAKQALKDASLNLKRIEKFRTLDPRELVMTPFSFSNSLILQNKIGAGIFHFRFVQAYQ